MPNKKITWEFIYQEREANLFPFYVFAKPWGMTIKSVVGKNINPIMLIFSRKGVEYYLNQKVFRQLGRKIYNLFLDDRFYQDMCGKIDKYTKELTNLSNSIKNKKLTSLSDKKLIECIKQIFKLVLTLNKWGQLLSLTEYGFNDYTTRGLMKVLEDKVKDRKINLTAVQASKVLSSPIKSSYFREEKLDLLKIAYILLRENLTINSLKIKEEIKKHQKRFCWVDFGYTGPAHGYNYYISEIKEIIKNKKEKVNEIYLEKKKELIVIKQEQQKLEKELGLSKLDKRRFFIVRDQTYYKEYRKEVLFHGFYVCELIQKELAKRWQVPVKSFYYILPNEYHREKINKLYQQRKKLCLYYIDDNQEFVFSGVEAEKKLKTLKKADRKVEEVKELKGNAAFIGKVKGKVKVVMGVNHLKKVKKGDILVSFSTSPQMVVTMKKAGAIVTEQGGVTSHAAIVSRELKIPCLVGVKDATKVFKDGDKVEVDATRGIIKKYNY